MRVFLVVCESGECSDHGSWVESAHATRDGAVRSILANTLERKAWLYDTVDDHDTVVHGSSIVNANVRAGQRVRLVRSHWVSEFVHPVADGDAWFFSQGNLVDDGEDRTWHIEEMEVRE